MQVVVLQVVCVVVLQVVCVVAMQVVCVVVLRAVVDRRGNHDIISNPGDWYHGHQGPQAQQKKDEPSTTFGEIIKSYICHASM